MNNAKGILNFGFELDRFLDYGESIVSNDTKKSLDHSFQRVENTLEKLSAFSPKQPKDAAEIYRYFITCAESDPNYAYRQFSNFRLARKLAWCLSFHEDGQEPIIDSKHLKLALRIIKDHFKPSMTIAIFIAILKNWISYDTKILKALISHKLRQLITKNRNILSIKERSHYFLESNGIIRLSEDIVEQNLDITATLNYLDMTSSMVSFEFFSAFAEAYTKILSRKNNFIEKLDSIFEFLRIHNSKDTYKKSLTIIINRVNRLNESKDIRMKILNECFKHIGNPSSDVDWAPWIGANEQDILYLEKARNILNQWLANKFLFLFFDKIAMDSDRRIFWQRYIKHVGNFRIYLNEDDLYRFRRSNTEIDSSILKHKIGTLEKGGDSNCFVFEIGNYYFAEFSKAGGACYIYKTDNKLKPDLKLSWIDILQLKHPSNRQLAVRVDSDYYYFKDEGRVFHNGRWQPKFDQWIKRYLKIRA